MPLNRNQNQTENQNEITLENFDPKSIKVSQPHSHEKPVNYIAYNIYCKRIRMQTKMKINRFSCDNISLSMDISKEQQEILNSIENQIRVETRKQDAELKKLNSRAKIITENLKIVKESAFSGTKMYGKLYLRDDELVAKFFQKEDDKKRVITNPLEITSEFHGEVVFDISRVFLGENESIICVVEAVLVDEIEKVSYFDELETVEDGYE